MVQLLSVNVTTWAAAGAAALVALGAEPLVGMLQEARIRPAEIGQAQGVARRAGYCLEAGPMAEWRGAPAAVQALVATHPLPAKVRKLVRAVPEDGRLVHATVFLGGRLAVQDHPVSTGFGLMGR